MLPLPHLRSGGIVLRLVGICSFSIALPFLMEGERERETEEKITVSPRGEKAKETHACISR